MGLLLSLWIPIWAFSCGPDFCGKKTDCLTYAGNVSPPDQVYFVSGCLPGLPHLDPENYTSQNIDLFMNEFFGLKEVKARVDNYGFDICQASKSDQAKEFFNRLIKESGISRDDEKKLLALRNELSEICLQGSGGAEYGKKLEALSDSLRKKDPVRYLWAIKAFYLKEFDNATAEFRKLMNDSGASLQEISHYMLGRVATVQAQEKWNGYERSELKDKEHLSQGEEAFKAYLVKYPKGEYAESALGSIRRTAYLKSEESRYLSLLAEAIEREEGKTLASKSKIRDLLYEYDPIGKTKKDGMHPFFWLIRSYYLQRVILEDVRSGFSLDEEWKDLLTHKDSFKKYPGLFSFISANLLLGMGKYAEAKAVLPASDKEANLGISYGVLKARILMGLKDYDSARTVIASYIDRKEQSTGKSALPDLHTDPQGPDSDKATLRDFYSFTFRWQGKIMDSFLEKHAAYTSPGTQDIFARRALSNADLEKIVAGKSTAQVYRKMGADIATYRYIFSQNFSAALKSSKSSDSPKLKAIKPFLEVLAKNKKNGENKLRLSNSLIDQDEKAIHLDIDYVSRCKEFGQDKLKWPIRFYKEIIDSFGNEKSSIQKEALSKAIHCYGTRSVSSCYDTSAANGDSNGTVPVAERKRWFKLLHTKYSDSKEAEETPYYW